MYWLGQIGIIEDDGKDDTLYRINSEYKDFVEDAPFSTNRLVETILPDAIEEILNNKRNTKYIVPRLTGAELIVPPRNKDGEWSKYTGDFSKEYKITGY